MPYPGHESTNKELLAVNEHDVRPVHWEFTVDVTVIPEQVQYPQLQLAQEGTP